MRSVFKWVLVGFLVVLALGFAAEAGGKGALKLTLYEGTWNTTFTPPRVVLPAPANRVEAGYVLVTSTGNGKVEITVKLKSDDPDAADETFDASIRRLSDWGPDQGEQLTSNKQGQGTLHMKRDIPDPTPDRFKVHLVNGDKSVAFGTVLALIDLK